MMTALASKAMRGTKRQCASCQARFYDLMREEIACPACGALYVPVAISAAEAGRRSAPGSAKTGWRQNFKRPSPALPEPDPQIEAPSPEDAEAGAEEVVADAAPEDDMVLEQEPDDGDVSGLVEVDTEEPKER